MDPLSSYITLINQVVVLSDSTHNMMHIHAGMVIYLLMLLIMKGLRAFPIAWFMVVAAAFLHETLERLHYGSWRVDDTVGDIVLTLLWPTIITSVMLIRNRRYIARPQKRSARR